MSKSHNLSFVSSKCNSYFGRAYDDRGRVASRKLIICKPIYRFHIFQLMGASPKQMPTQTGAILWL